LCRLILQQIEKLLYIGGDNWRQRVDLAQKMVVLVAVKNARSLNGEIGLIRMQSARNCHAGENAPEISSFRERSAKPERKLHVTFLGPEAVDAVPQEQQDASSITASMPIRASAQESAEAQGVHFVSHPRSRTDLRGWARPGPRPQLQLRGWSYGADDVGRGRLRNRCSN
jgi:hypothetical protein